MTEFLKPEEIWIQTYTGKAFYPLAPRVEDIDIEDIAHSLSMQCRFTGHTKDFYSVGQHCAEISEIVPEEDALWGLLHDASEAYLVDLCRPLKRLEKLGSPYREIEARLMLAICERFGLAPEQPASVKEADLRMLMTEKRDLMRVPPLPWVDQGEPYEARIHPLSYFGAKEFFLGRFEACKS